MDVRALMREYVGDNVDNTEFMWLFNINNSIALHTCVNMVCDYPELNNFLKFYLKNRNDIDINQISFQGRTALHAACHNAWNNYSNELLFPFAFETIEILIDAGINVNLQDHSGSTALHIVAECCSDHGYVYEKKKFVEHAKRIIELLIVTDAVVFNLIDRRNRSPCDYFSNELIEHYQIDKEAQTVGIKTGRLTKAAKK